MTQFNLVLYLNQGIGFIGLIVIF